MEVGIHANICNQATSHVARVLRPVFEELSKRLAGEYGGVIEHLWMDLELVESHASAVGRQRYPFRFQKRVSGRSQFGLGAIPDRFNVGHFSVRPDFKVISTLPTEQLIPYVLSLIYDATAMLLEKQGKLGGFDAALFRSKLLEAYQSLGYSLSSNSSRTAYEAKRTTPCAVPIR
jgi:hypothetical protein